MMGFQEKVKASNSFLSWGSNAWTFSVLVLWTPKPSRAPVRFQGLRAGTFVLQMCEPMAKVKTEHSMTQVMYLIHFGKVLLMGHEKSYTLVGVCRKQ